LYLVYHVIGSHTARFFKPVRRTETSYPYLSSSNIKKNRSKQEQAIIQDI